MAGVARVLPSWIQGRVTYVADAWGRLDPPARAALDAEAEVVAEAATRRVVDELRVLFATAPARQRSTPLEVVRSAVREVSAVLAAAGIPPVERDAFAVRAFPHDVYGLTPATLADLGDDDLGPLHMVWGLAKATVLRAGAADR